MMQSLLADRFKLAVHFETHQAPVFALTLSKPGTLGLNLRPHGGAVCRRLIGRQPAPGLVHHSDRGVQYASYDYTEMLKQHHANISMSRKGNPYDKAHASHCTSNAPCRRSSPADRLFDNLTPMALRGGLSPGVQRVAHLFQRLRHHCAFLQRFRGLFRGGSVVCSISDFRFSGSARFAFQFGETGLKFLLLIAQQPSEVFGIHV
jgi:hypothetical protein